MEAGCVGVSVCLCLCASVCCGEHRGNMPAGALVWLSLSPPWVGSSCVPLPRVSLHPSPDLAHHPEALGDTEVDLPSRRQRM